MTPILPAGDAGDPGSGPPEGGRHRGLWLRVADATLFWGQFRLGAEGHPKVGLRDEEDL